MLSLPDSCSSWLNWRWLIRLPNDPVNPPVKWNGVPSLSLRESRSTRRHAVVDLIRAASENSYSRIPVKPLDRDLP